MKSRWPAVIFFLVLALLDNALALAFPLQTTYTGISFAARFAFLFLIMAAWTQPLLDRLLWGILAGLVTDLFFTGTFPVFALLYGLFLVAAGMATKLGTSKKILYAVSFFLLFLLDFIPYALTFLLSSDAAYIHEWFYDMELFTLLGNMGAWFAIWALWQLIREFQLHREEKERRRKEQLAARKKKAKTARRRTA